jgi:hypothetical protein
MMGIADEIEALRRLGVPELVARYEELFGKPPRVKNREHLWKRCAWKLQEARFGGLSAVAKERLESLISQLDLPATEAQRTVSGVLVRPPKPGMSLPGTTIVREWRGQRIEVRVLEKGYEWNGVAYRSLSAVARAATGCRWNGKLFFGLTARRRKA